MSSMWAMGAEHKHQAALNFLVGETKRNVTDIEITNCPSEAQYSLVQMLEEISLLCSSQWMISFSVTLQ